MLVPAIPADEAERLQLLHDLLVLDSDPEPAFDTLARMASDVCGAPIALLSQVPVGMARRRRQRHAGC